MIRRIKGEEPEQIKYFAKEIINAIAKGEYDLIIKKVDDMGSWDAMFLARMIEEFKKDNDYDKIDCYDIPCTYNPQYKDNSLYKQEDVFEYSGGNSYGYEYDLTTNGQPNDLVLQMKFELVNENEIKVIFEGGIVV